MNGRPASEHLPAHTPHPTRAYATLTFLRGGLLSLTVAVMAGLLAGLYYVPAIGSRFMDWGIDFAVLRPIHTVFAAAWIYLGGLAVVHRYFEDHAGPPSAAERWRLRLQVSLWGLAGLGVLGTLISGISSGREYMGFHPALSLPIILGWGLFGWNFFSATRRGFWSRPVYVTMWGVGVLFFAFTFIEQHAWLIPEIFRSPVVDLRLQWKATGTLVGSFNLFVYGSLIYLGEKLSGDENYAQSHLAYALFGVGLLNSFTNFAHHTYHIPQSELVKWISFVVSMTEILIVARVLWDLVALVAKRTAQAFNSARYFLVLAKWWTLAMVFSSVLISIPPLNSLIHGTHVVTGHAMGAEIGIDSMVLFGATSWLLMGMFARQRRDDGVLHSSRLWFMAAGFNISTVLLVVWLNVSGVIVGYTRFQDLAPPTWLASSNGMVFATVGLAVALFLTGLLWIWLRCLFGSAAEPVAAGGGGAR